MLNSVELIGNIVVVDLSYLPPIVCGSMCDVIDGNIDANRDLGPSEQESARAIRL